MRINNNIAAQNTYLQMSINSTAQSKNMEKLSSGLRINRGADDAAGLSISEKMRAQIRGLDRAAQNAQDGISMIQTADGALNESHSILQRMRELTVQASNGTNNVNEVDAIKSELTQLKDTLESIATTTKFNDHVLLNGTAGTDGTIVIQTGANATENFEIDLKYFGGDSEGDPADPALDLATLSTEITTALDSFDTDPSAFITALDTAIQGVSTGRAYLGAVQNRLEYTVNNLNASSQNIQSAESRIRDVDMAKEVMENSKNSILAQAAQAMLAQSNQMPQGVLQLLR